MQIIYRLREEREVSELMKVKRDHDLSLGEQAVSTREDREVTLTVWTPVSSFDENVGR